MPVIPASQEVVIRRIVAPGQPWQKVSKTPFQPIAEHSGTCLSSCMVRIDRKITIQVGLGNKSKRLLEK
jgi:hypothetical protein